MIKGLISLLLVGFLASCPVFSPPQKQEKIILMGLSDDGLVFIRDTDSDGKLDRKLYYRLIGTTEKDAEALLSNRYYVFKYQRGEAYPSGSNFHDLPYLDLDLEESVVFQRN